MGAGKEVSTPGLLDQIALQRPPILGHYGELHMYLPGKSSLIVVPLHPADVPILVLHLTDGPFRGSRRRDRERKETKINFSRLTTQLD